MESSEKQHTSTDASNGERFGETYNLQQVASRPKIYTKARQKKLSMPSFFFGALPLEHETTFFILVSVLDIFMTWYLISHSSRQIVEANPVAAYFLYRWGGNGLVAFKMFMVAVVCVLTQIIERYKAPLGLRVLQLGTVVVGLVVIYSFVLAVKTSNIP